MSTVIKERISRDKREFKLEWTIEQFEYYKDSQETLYSAGTTMEELGMTGHEGRWRICVKPCFQKVKGRKNTTTGATGSEIIRSGTMERQSFSSESFRMGDANWLSYDELFGTTGTDGKIEDDTISLEMEVVIYTASSTTRFVRSPANDNPSDRYKQFIKKQLDWLRSPRHPHSTDFTLQASNGKEFRVSRFVLMSHSEYFAGMLSQNTTEKQTSRCSLVEDAETVEILLDYLYGLDTARVTNANAEKILVAADKYILFDLIGLCEETLAQTVTAGTAAHRLALARRLRLDTLERAALKLIPKNMAAAMADEALQGAIREDPDIAEIIEVHCSKKSRS
ncbi:speckle-type POZ protein homolog [Paramacrobiotus metropolitanus]|uniref:speckle-type POZ protein homolog n=1 Tax=Paramacrobiotus metropolitanus TaxID=2943436 RepID=UPI002446351D|nr:speckle-type POZ protein homolog [Paramacrobiotus metropolitanus]